MFCALRTTSSGLGAAKSKGSALSCPYIFKISVPLECKWLGSAIVGPEVPTIALANVEGEARILGTGCWQSASWGSLADGEAGVDTSGTEGFLASELGAFWVDGGDGAGAGLAGRPEDPESSEGFGVDLPLAASLSRRDCGVPRGSGDAASDRPDWGVGGFEASGVPLSFFFRAAAKAASFESFPPPSGAPPRRPRRGYRGSMRISAFR